MTWFFVTLPLMIVAVGIAVVPVVYHSLREHRALQEGALPHPTTGDARSSEYWTRPGPARVVAVRDEQQLAA
jgi:hypothetical protein